MCESYKNTTSENSTGASGYVRDFSEDEETLIARMFKLVGKRWHLIAGRIPGRSAEEIEKYWTSKYFSQPIHA
ncbi:hypothetical protein ACHQM5_003541 [Ranunculus cassubicifolius]